MPRTAPLLLSLSLLGGCFGTFQLTQKVWDFNKEISDSFVVQEVLFLAFVIIPVYPISALADALVLNTIEVVTGENPIGAAPRESRAIALADGGTLAIVPEDDGSVVLELDRDGRRLQRKLRRKGGHVEISEGDRVLVALDVADDGTALLTDEEGRSIVLDHDDLQRAARAHAVGGTAALGHEVSRILAEAR